MAAMKTGRSNIEILEPLEPVYRWGLNLDFYTQDPYPTANSYGNGISQIDPHALRIGLIMLHDLPGDFLACHVSLALKR